MNKVRTKKGDKFEERNWSSASHNENGDDEGDDTLPLPGLPSRFQQALTAARLVNFNRIFSTFISQCIGNELPTYFLPFRFSPEKSPPATEIRARASQRQESKEIPENIPETKVTKEKPKTPKPKTSKKCRWVLFIVILILIILSAALVYNFEELPAIGQKIEQLLPDSTVGNNPTK